MTGNEHYDVNHRYDDTACNTHESCPKGAVLLLCLPSVWWPPNITCSCLTIGRKCFFVTVDDLLPEPCRFVRILEGVFHPLLHVGLRQLGFNCRPPTVPPSTVKSSANCVCAALYTKVRSNGGGRSEWRSTGSTCYCLSRDG